MLNIQTKLTPYNFTTKNNVGRIKYIVIHYVGAVSTAYSNVVYLSRQYVGASAHYYVDENSIWQAVEDKDASWHCGGGLQGNKYHSKYQICTNSNSIGIEMCVKKTSSGQWYFEDGTVNNTIDLVKYLMNKYHVPFENVIRHADVTGKPCPEPYCYSTAKDNAWDAFKSRIGGNNVAKITDCELVGKIVNCSALNVRNCPSTDGVVIGKLNKGDTVWIDGKCDNGWYRANFKGTVGVGYFSGDYVEIAQTEKKHSYDNTVNNLIVDGITTIENMGYWERVLNGQEAVNLDYLRTLLDRYHNKL